MLVQFGIYVQLTVFRATCINGWKPLYVTSPVVQSAYSCVSSMNVNEPLLPVIWASESFHVCVLHGWAYFTHCVASMQWDFVCESYSVMCTEVYVSCSIYYKTYRVHWSVTLYTCCIGSRNPHGLCKIISELRMCQGRCVANLHRLIIANSTVRRYKLQQTVNHIVDGPLMKIAGQLHSVDQDTLNLLETTVTAVLAVLQMKWNRLLHTQLYFWKFLICAC